MEADEVFDDVLWRAGGLGALDRPREQGDLLCLSAPQFVDHRLEGEENVLKFIALAQLPGEPKAVREVCISSLLHTAYPMHLSDARVVATAKVSALIDDFSHGLRDWYQLNAGNLTHQQSWTRKFTDPMYRGADGAKLKLTLIMPSANRLTFVLSENEWRSYRGPRKTFVCERSIPGSDTVQTAILEASDFSDDGGPLKSWAQIDQLGICAYNPERRDPAKSPPPWNGAAAKFLRLEWE